MKNLSETPPSPAPYPPEQIEAAAIRFNQDRKGGNAERKGWMKVGY